MQGRYTDVLLAASVIFSISSGGRSAVSSKYTCDSCDGLNHVKAG